MITHQQIKTLMDELGNKGFASNCPPDNFKFMSHDNAYEYLNALNSLPLDDGVHFESVQLDEPWGNCVALYKREEGMREKALAALDNYADEFSKEFKIPRVWNKI